MNSIVQDIAVSSVNLENQVNFHYSESRSKIISALLKVQKEMGVALKDSTNPHFKSTYANYRSVWNAVGSLLNQNEIIFNVFPSGGPRIYTFLAVLMHASGEYVKASIEIEASKSGPQEFGSLSTYMKRYLLQLLTGVATDEDDDGNSAQGRGDKPKGNKHQGNNPNASNGNYDPNKSNPPKPPQEPKNHAPKTPKQKLIDLVKRENIAHEDVAEIIYRCTGQPDLRSDDLTNDQYIVIENYVKMTKKNEQAKS